MLFVLQGAISAQAAVIPYLPPLHNFGGTSVDLSTFLPVTDDYTLEVQGTAGSQISVAGGVYSYTPETSGTVRFSQKNGKVYVYEENVYKTTLTPVAIQATYPDIYAEVSNSTNQTGIYNPTNLIVNPGFETTTGPNLNTEADKRYAAATWTATTGFTSTGVRVNVDNASYVTGREGLATLLWRNDGAGLDNTTTYFYQSLGSKLKANTKYKIKFHVLTHNQGRSCNWRVGVGSTAGGYQYSLNIFKPVSTNFTSQSFEYTFTTPSTVAGETFFTVGNNGDATNANWTIIHLDRLTLVEGTVPKGINGVSSASFAVGAAYAPEGVSVDFAQGDYYDITSYIKNASFEDVQADRQQNIPNWTKTGAANGEYCTRNDAGPASGTFKTGNVYFQYWSNANPRPDFSISQVITDLPNGKYRLTAGAGGDAGTTGTYVYAADNQTQVTTTGDHSVEATVVNGSLTIGFKSVSRTVNWAFADNFRLYYLGVSQDPVLTVSATNLSYDANNLTKTFNVSGAFLTENVVLTAPEGITLSKTTLTAAEANAGVDITAQFTGTASIKTGSISIVCGAITKTISVFALYGDGACFTPLYSNRTNVVSEPFANDRSKFGGWGNVGISEITKFCGERSLKIFGGSLDVSVAGGAVIGSNKAYRFRAKIYVPAGHTARFGLFGIGQSSSDIIVYNSATNDTWETVDFTFKTATMGTGGIFIQRATGADSVYVDNLEMYEVTEPTVRVKYVDADNVATSIKDDRVYNATWGATVADYLTIGKSFTTLATDKESISNPGGVYSYDNTSIDNVVITEGENVITLKFTKDISTGSANLNDGLLVYPTLTDGNVRVDMGGKTGTIAVYDVYGRLVLSKNTTAGIETIALPASGMYLVKVNIGNDTKTVKVTRVK